MKSRTSMPPGSVEQAPPSDLLAPNSFFRPGVREILACGIAALVYTATLSFGFVYDDVPQILKNPAIQEWRFVPQYFTSHVWAAIYPNTSGNYYRPVFLLWLRLNFALFGTRALGWHLTSVACHVLATWLVLRIAHKLSGDRLTAFIAALIFAVHPAHIENVAWISGVADPLMTCFLLGSLDAFLSFRELRRVWYAVPSLALFALALLAKETAIVFPILIFAFVMIFERDANRPALSIRRLMAAIGESIPYLLLVLIYAVVRFRALGGWSHPTIPIGWTVVFLTWPSVLLFYLQHLIETLPLSEFYSLDYVKQATGAAFQVPLVSVVAAAGILFVVIRRLSQKNVAVFALALIVVPLLPVLDLRSLSAGDIVHDRYLYLPSVGFALLIALIIREWARHRQQGWPKVVPVAFTVAIVAGFAACTVIQQRQWANDILLYTRGLESAPGNLTVRDNLASALLNGNQPARAIPLYLEVIHRNPGFWRSNYNLGFAYYKTSNFQAAEDYLQRAIRIDPSDSDQYIYLALVQLQLKKLPQAAENASRAIARNPRARGYHYVLGLVYEAGEERARAAAEFRTEIAEHSENAGASAELKKLEGISASP